METVEYYLAIRKDETLLCVTTWMDLERIMLSKISQMISLICEIQNRKQQMN